VASSAEFDPGDVFNSLAPNGGRFAAKDLKILQQLEGAAVDYDYGMFADLIALFVSLGGLQELVFIFSMCALNNRILYWRRLQTHQFIRIYEKEQQTTFN